MRLGMAVRHEGHQTVVVLNGEVDAATAPELDVRLAMLNLEGHDDLVLDLRDVALVDSTGLGALVAARNRCVDGGGSFRLHRPQPTVRKVISVTGLDEVLPVLE